MSPYQREIRRVTGITAQADLDAIEDAMRTARGTLDSLSTREFREEAQMGWHVVRANRVMTASGIGISHPDALNPAVHAAASIYVQQNMTGPLTRPLTFRAPEQERPAGRSSRAAGHSAQPAPEWVTYAIPAAAWRAGMTRAQASTYDQGDLAPHDVIGYEALCRRCGEIFNPDLTYPDRSGLEHYQDAGGWPCGGAGDIIGWWG